MHDKSLTIPTCRQSISECIWG